MRPVILVFAKAPIPGRVKTRLHTVLTPDQAAGLHKAFVFDTLESLNQLAHSVDIELHSDIQHASEWPIPHRLQAQGDLGQRMLAALAQAFGEGRPQALILGADSPTLPVAYLQQLLSAPADVALGPSEDGGYYAICARKIHEAMFAGVEWSTGFVLSQTRSACARAGLSVQLGTPWWDVDEPADLHRLRREKYLPRHTRAILEGYGWTQTAREGA